MTGLIVYAYKEQDDQLEGRAEDDLGAVIILVVRYGAQIMRMISLISRAKKTRDRLNSQKDIEFEACDDGEMPVTEFVVLGGSELDNLQSHSPVPQTPGRHGRGGWIGFDDDDDARDSPTSAERNQRGLRLSEEDALDIDDPVIPSSI